MKELYLTMAVLCFLVAMMVYCVNKTIRALRELYITWKIYKQSQEDFEDFMKELYRENKCAS